MTHNPKIHRRRSLRLTEYDYTQVGAYFVTIVLQNRLCLFGEIIKTEMQLSEAGEMVHQAWEHYPIGSLRLQLIHSRSCPTICTVLL